MVGKCTRNPIDVAENSENLYNNENGAYKWKCFTVTCFNVSFNTIMAPKNELFLLNVWRIPIILPGLLFVIIHMSHYSS